MSERLFGGRGRSGGQESREDKDNTSVFLNTDSPMGAGWFFSK
jgi:hypothetical protein